VPGESPEKRFHARKAMRHPGSGTRLLERVVVAEDRRFAPAIVGSRGRGGRECQRPQPGAPPDGRAARLPGSGPGDGESRFVSQPPARARSSTAKDPVARVGLHHTVISRTV
jgi:hypothetical protein